MLVAFLSFVHCEGGLSALFSRQPSQSGWWYDTVRNFNPFFALDSWQFYISNVLLKFIWYNRPTNQPNVLCCFCLHNELPHPTSNDLILERGKKFLFSVVWIIELIYTFPVKPNRAEFRSLWLDRIVTLLFLSNWFWFQRYFIIFHIYFYIVSSLRSSCLDPLCV